MNGRAHGPVNEPSTNASFAGNSSANVPGYNMTVEGSPPLMRPDSTQGGFSTENDDRTKREPRSNKKKGKKHHKTHYHVTAKPRDINHSHGAPTCTTLLAIATEKILTRHELGIFFMRMDQLDPYEEFEYVDRPVEGPASYATEQGINLYINYQKTDLAHRDTYPAEIKALPDLDPIYWDLMETIKVDFGNSISEKIQNIFRTKYNLYGHGGFHIAHPISVKTPRTFLGLSLGWSTLASTPVAYVLDVDNWVQQRYNESYIIAPGHCDVVIPVSRDRDEQIKWIARHKSLFFGSDLKLNEKKLGVDYTLAVEEDGLKYSYITTAAEGLGKKIAGDTVDALKYEAYGETYREKFLNYVYGKFPGYNAWQAHRRHDDEQAVGEVVADVVDAASVVAGPLGKTLKVVKLGGVRKVVKTVNTVVNPVGKVVGRVGGAVGKKVAGKEGGFVGKWVAKKIVGDQPYSGKSVVKNHFKGNPDENRRHIPGHHGSSSRS